MNNNPLRYTDPSGHDVDCGMGESGCSISVPFVVPNGMVVPTDLPEFDDPILLEAWIWLYNSNSGRYLAEYIQDYNIRIIYGDDNGVAITCSGQSCTIAPGTPIEIINNPGASLYDSVGVRQRAGLLAQEAYHYTRPYGNVKPSLLEEYNSYQLHSTVVSELQAWADYPEGTSTIGGGYSFDGYNPGNSGSLMNWFDSNGLTNYLGYVEAGLYTFYPNNWPSSGGGWMRR